MNRRTFTRSAIILTLTTATLFGSTGCSSLQKTWNGMSQTGQGAAAGGTAGAAIGAGVGALIGGGRGSWIGALVGSALGAGTGAVVGNSMQRQKDALEAELDQLRSRQDATDSRLDETNARLDETQQQLNDIKIQMVKDRNNLDAIKMVMGDAVLFPTGKYTLSAAAQAALSRVAYNLKQFPDTDITVVGYTDNTGTEAINQKLSMQRAQSVVNYLKQQGVAADRLKAVGEGWNDPIASNATPEGRAQNRRVELFITANAQLIQNANNQ